MEITLIGLPEILPAFGWSKSTAYNRVEEGTFPPPVKTGRMSRWPKHERDAVLAAVLSGASDDELSDLVKRLVAQRKELIDGSIYGNQSMTNAAGHANSARLAA